jgi:CDP-paratose 2-epimerase
MKTTALAHPAHVEEGETPAEGGAVLITGGAGFIGCHLAARLLRTGCRVLILDDLSSVGAARNLSWLRDLGGQFEACIGDIRDATTVRAAVAKSSLVYHLAARDANSALVDPLLAFGVNTYGTLVLLEAIRTAATPPGLVFLSTTDVYGTLRDVDLEPYGMRCRPRDARLRTGGVG